MAIHSSRSWLQGLPVVLAAWSRRLSKLSMHRAIARKVDGFSLSCTSSAEYGEGTHAGILS